MKTRFIPMKTLDSIIKNAGKAMLPLTFLAMPLMAQNQVTGHVEKVPSKSNAFARITLTDVANNDQYITLTDSITGTFDINVPTATYQRKVEVQDNFLFLDTLDINSAQYMDLQTIQNLGKETTVYNTILEVFKVLTATRDYPWSTNFIMERWHDEDQPIKVWKRAYDPADPYSMPQNYAAFMDSAINDIFNKSDGKVVFSVQPDSVSIGINFEYRHSDEMPIPGVFGYTLVEESYPDNSPKRAEIWINRDDLSPQQKNGVFRREFMRTMVTTDDALDNTYIMGWQSQAEFLHPDEGKVLQIMYTLRNGTDMKPLKYTIVQGPAQITRTISLNQGWNMVSMPVDAENDSAIVNFPLLQGNAYGFNGSYIPAYTLQNGKGYWVKYPTADSVSITGVYLESIGFNVPSPGWTMLGSVSDAVGLNSLYTIPAGCNTGNVYKFENGSYQIADSLKPGNGYWIKLTQPCNVIIDSSP